MVETSTASPMAEADITAMKETLRAQQILLQQLHAELDQEREASATAASEAMDMILRLQGEKAAEDYPNGSLDSYWNQIKKLDEKVKEISDCKESGVEICPRPRIRRGRSCSLLSQLGSPATSDQTDKVISSRASRHGSTNDRESVASVSTLVNVHDVFEVPQASEKKVLEADSRLTKPDSLSDEIVESNVRPDIDKRKSKIIPQKPISKDMKTIIRQKKEEMDAESNASRAEIQRLHQRIERLERERMNPRPHEGDKEEHLRLLKEIYHRITLIMSEIKSIKTETPPPKNVPLDPLQEMMMNQPIINVNVKTKMVGDMKEA
ncbi:hypothetical protein AHAS_Ahas01G0221000 [Arachis hypogaea]